MAVMFLFTFSVILFVGVNPAEVGSRLMFTEYIKAGQISEARSLSLVTGLEPSVTSYSGFFTVEEKCDSNLFFWFFPSLNDPATDPVTVWLEGGPGATSFYGALTELGTLNLNLNGTLELRKYPWTKNSSVIFIDSPVGTGYSYTRDTSCSATEQTRVGRDVVNALEQFYQVFPEYQGNDLYIAGISYGGKYVPAVAYTIHNNSDSSIRPNLKGISMGNGWTDPLNQLQYSDYLYQIGVIDDNLKDQMETIQNNIRDFIGKEKFFEATQQWEEILALMNGVGFTSLYNFLYENAEPEGNVDDFVTRSEVRKALHTGDAVWHNSSSSVVFQQLYADITRSVKPWLEELLENYKVLIYSGQIDLIVPYPLTVSFLKKLEWSGKEEYQKAPRKQWRVGSSLAGYVKTVGNLNEVLIRNAGHLVQEDQPEWAQDLFNRFISDQPISYLI